MPASPVVHATTTVAGALALLLSGMPQPAQAAGPAEETPPDAEIGEVEQVDPKLQAAREAFERGEALYAKARFEAALEAFLDAQALYPSPDFHYNIGQCYESLGKYEEAIRSYRSYLRNAPDAADYASVEAKVERLEKLAEGEQADPGPAATDESKSKPGKALVVSGAALIGVGAIGAVAGGLAFGAVASDRSAKVDDINAGNNPGGLTLTDVEALDQQGRRAEVLQIVTAGVGGGVAIVGAVLMAIGLKRRGKAGANTQARLPALAPLLGARSGGIIIRGRF